MLLYGRVFSTSISGETGRTTLSSYITATSDIWIYSLNTCHHKTSPINILRVARPSHEPIDPTAATALGAETSSGDRNPDHPTGLCLSNLGRNSCPALTNHHLALLTSRSPSSRWIYPMMMILRNGGYGIHMNEKRTTIIGQLADSWWFVQFLGYTPTANSIHCLSLSIAQRYRVVHFWNQFANWPGRMYIDAGTNKTIFLMEGSRKATSWLVFVFMSLTQRQG